MPDNYYQISWLEIAINNLKKDNDTVNVINGNTTIHDFIRQWAYKELNDLYID